MFIDVVSLQSYVQYVMLGYDYWCGLLAELCAVCNTYCLIYCYDNSIRFWLNKFLILDSGFLSIWP